MILGRISEVYRGGFSRCFGWILEIFLGEDFGGFFDGFGVDFGVLCAIIFMAFQDDLHGLSR